MTTIAQYLLLSILSAFLVFHFLVILKIIPYDKVWGGRLKSDTEMYRFESVSILIILLFLFVIISHIGLINIVNSKNILKFGFWLMTILFAVNSVGNFISINKFERNYFTPLTILLTLLSLILALSY